MLLLHFFHLFSIVQGKVGSRLNFNIVYGTVIFFPQCDKFMVGNLAEKFFRWSMRDPKNYIEPQQLSYSCRKESGGYCRFPQDIRSQSYWSEYFESTYDD